MFGRERRGKRKPLVQAQVFLPHLVLAVLPHHRRNKLSQLQLLSTSFLLQGPQHRVVPHLLYFRSAQGIIPRLLYLPHLSSISDPFASTPATSSSTSSSSVDPFMSSFGSSTSQTSSTSGQLDAFGFPIAAPSASSAAASSSSSGSGNLLDF